jgi:alpha-tubulin suppressor-like RCC1 family protein
MGVNLINGDIFPSPTLITLSNITQISLGSDFSLILSNGMVFNMGTNKEGQLGTNFFSNSKINEKNLPLMLYSFNNINTNLKIDNIIQISAGFTHSIILNQDGNAYSFGENYVKFFFLNFKNGQLGMNDKNRRYYPTLIPTFNNIKQISTGYYHSMFIINTGEVYSFGHNSVNIINNLVRTTRC